MYKVITKVLVNRLKPVLPSLISPIQCNFVPNRQIIDNVIIMQEMLHTLRRKQGKKGSMVVKIDFEKAYDRLKCPFIRDSLLELRLPQNIVDVVMHCITSTKLQTLWNGEPMEAFYPSRGIRQGDPLSPYLYVICMERLTHLIEREVQMGSWRPLRASRYGPALSNLAFADDLILFGDASLEQAETMKKCLDTFCATSGSKVSLSKSKIYFSPNTNAQTREAVCRSLDMEATTDMGMYLGVPTIQGRMSSAAYNYMVDRIDLKLAGWKQKMLSTAGRVTLAQSSLCSTPSYVMQSTKLPRSICGSIDRKIRGFVWGDTSEKKRVHPVAWECVTKPKDAGGLGLRSMRQANAAFLAKLGWRVLTEPQTLWSRVLRSKYCEGRCDLDMFTLKADSSNAWRGIVENINIVQQGINAAVGNGKKTFFWHHRWATNDPLLKHASPEPPKWLQDVTVSEMWDRTTGWKFDLFADYLAPEFLQRIMAYELVEDENADDEYFWNGSPSGTFTIKSALKILRNDEEMDEGQSKNWQVIWKAPVPQRVRFFLWLVFHGRVMTNAARFLRGLTEDPRCYVCGYVEENIDHILRRCPATTVVWRSLGWDGEGSFINEDFKGWLTRNLSLKACKKGEEWPRAFAMTCWWLWKWRNERIFAVNPRIPIDQGAFLMARCREVCRAFEVDGRNSSNKRKREEVLIRWRYPHEGWVKLNTDGAARGNPGPAGGGGHPPRT